MESYSVEHSKNIFKIGNFKYDCRNKILESSCYTYKNSNKLEKNKVINLEGLSTKTDLIEFIRVLEIENRENKIIL